MDEFKRLKELADRSYQSGQYVFTDFMSMAELAVFYENEKELAYACPALSGGYEDAERQMICFCRDTLSSFIMENLSKVKHTSVKAEIVEDPGSIVSPERKEKVIQVQSNRIDAVTAKVYGLSRQEALTFFAEHRVFLNGRECTGNAKTLNPGDIISIRGKGRFEYAEELNLSKKGKLNCRVMCW